MMEINRFFLTFMSGPFVGGSDDEEQYLKYQWVKTKKDVESIVKTTIVPHVQAFPPEFIEKIGDALFYFLNFERNILDDEFDNMLAAFESNGQEYFSVCWEVLFENSNRVYPNSKESYVLNPDSREPLRML